ncbi:MAG: phosphatidylserine/phosphatidylglycerophosphate/cardiolipin synthase family protein [Candidatus Nanoarchaeia archaeon]|nr:phosphatidylserine/phosphatidylglycerophosphate/cardiolipin synthase family protein [Candidatus Nanoarchaeia archaeon]
MKDFQVFSEAPELFKSMLKDIESAKDFIYLETYIFEDDPIGKKFMELFVKKAKEGVKIRLLIDAWELSKDKTFFRDLINSGGEVRFFRELRYVIRLLSKNHERNHRKLLLIDNNITYIGSANIGHRFITWREVVLRLLGDITFPFVKSFLKSWESFGDFSSKRIKSFFHKSYHIIQDFPSSIHRVTEKKFLGLINHAKKDIMIETPFFIPTERIRNALVNAIKRKVKITLIVPVRSDKFYVDVLRDRYLGKLHNEGVSIYYYKPSVLHAKLLIIDNSFFMLGSSNVDYRSFIYQYEINFFGKNQDIIHALKNHFNETLSKSELFNYNEWKKRSSFKKTLEIFMHFLRKFL